jgi:antitoxin component YwqK of YwqJK toxin-antitoxin module
MYRFILVFIILLYGYTAFSQEDTTWFDAMWQKTTKDKAAFFRPQPVKTAQGYLIADHFADGKVQMKGISELPDKTSWKGWVTWHYENGNIKQRALYVNNLIDSLVTYHTNGTVATIQPQRNGSIEGTAIVYDSLGELTGTIAFLSGRQHGEKKQYYNGQLRIIEQYKNGKQHGVAEYYGDNGLITSKENYVEGKREGFREEFYENGVIRNRTHYENDKRNGLEEDFDEQGRLKRTANYKDYELDGAVISYYTDGGIQSTAWYKNDYPVSIYSLYEPSGKIQLEVEFNKGILHGKYRRYNKGKLNIDGAFKKGSLQYWKSYHSNGKPWRHCVINTDSLTEHWTTWTENGKKLLETIYRFNSEEGTWKMYDEDDLALEITYRAETTKEAVERKTRRLLREKAEEAKKRKKEEGEEEKDETGDDEVENFDIITTDEVAATTLLNERAENVTDHLPIHYLSVENRMLDKENVFETFSYEFIRLYYGKGAIVFSRETEDSAIAVFFNGSLAPYNSEVNDLSFKYITNADGLQLIQEHEAYHVASDELAMFAEPPSEFVQRVMRFSIGNKLRKKILQQPLMLAAMARHLHQYNNQGFSLATISLELCREVFDKK